MEMIVGQKQREKLSLVFEFSLPYYFLGSILLYCFPPFLITVLHSSSLSECMQRSSKTFFSKKREVFMIFCSCFFVQVKAKVIFLVGMKWHMLAKHDGLLP